MRGLLLLLLCATLASSSSVHDIAAFGRNDVPESRHTLNFYGAERSYSLHEPTGTYEIDRYPLIVVLHGGGGSARSIVRLTQGHFNKIADREGAYVVYPEGVRKFWNEGRNLPLSYAHRNDVDDVAFIRSLIQDLSEKYPIDKERVFVTGMSNGGLMAFKLACELPDLITAIAPVTASLPRDIVNECSNVRGTSLIIINGTEDPYMPYQGGMITVFDAERGEVISTRETVRYWLEKNGCPMHSEKKMMPDNDRKDGTTVTVYAYSGCQTGVRVVLYRVEGGGHTWPGGRQYLKETQVGRTSRDINACEEIWSFFQSF